MGCKEELMKKIYKKLEKGIHIIPLLLEGETQIEHIFPKEISGSTLEILDASGDWINKDYIFYENNAFVVQDVYKKLKPFTVLRVNLKRDIVLEWDISFVSHCGLKENIINFELGFDFNEALYLAQLSKLVYEDKEVLEKTIEEKYNFDTFYYYSKQSHKKLLKKGLAKLLITFFRGKRSIIDLQFMHLSKIDQKSGKSLIIVVFRGSQEPQDWMTNFTFEDDDFKQKGRVHKGFKQAMELFFQTIKHKDLTAKHLPLTLIEDCKSINEHSTIILTGHSLGGALATLAGCHLYEMGISPENIEIYTFGAPPVGTEEFCRYYENKLNIYRIVNENDVVPKLDKITKFFHFGKEIILPSNDGEVHSCDGYIDNLIDSI